MSNNPFGELVEKELKHQRYSQRWLAEKIGKSPTYINYVVNGRNPSAKDGAFQPGRDSVIAIAKVLNLDVDHALHLAGYASKSQVPEDIKKALQAFQPIMDDMDVENIARHIDGQRLLKEARLKEDSSTIDTTDIPILRETRSPELFKESEAKVKKKEKTKD